MTRPTRILYLINSLGAGGTERQLIYLLSQLDRHRHEPIVVTLYNDRLISYHYGAELKALNIPIYSLNHTSGISGRAKAILRYIYFIWRFRPHIVQGCLHYANLIARVSRPFCPQHKLITSARAAYLSGEIRSEAYTHWLDTCLIVNSSHIRDQVLQNTRRPAHKIEVIFNGLPLENFAENHQPDLRQQLFPEATCVIGVIGRIAAQKDHLTLVEALHLCRDAWPKKLAVFFLGDMAEPEIYQQIIQRIEAYDLQNIIHIFEKTADVAPYYHASDFTVLPSLYEGFPNVVLESFATGKPVMLSDEANRSGIVEDGVTGWQFPVGDAPALASGLQNAWNRPQTSIQSMGQQASLTAQQYSIESMVTQYTRLYDSLRQTKSSKLRGLRWLNMQKK